MKVLVVKSRKDFRKEDLEKLDKHNAIFYEEKIGVPDIKELYEEEEVILAVQPTYMKELFESLSWKEVRQFKKLKGLVLATTAFGWVPNEELRKKGIAVANCPGKSTNAVAEGGFFSMIALLRKIPLLVQNNWVGDFSKLMGEEWKELHAGVIGLGLIGNRFAEICKQNGLEVSYWNRSKKKSQFNADSIENIFKKCDVVYLSFATDESLRGFIPNKLIDSMKPTALLISCIDNYVLDLEYVLKRVRDGKLGGCAFESEEHKSKDLHGNIWVSPESYYYFTTQTRDNESKIFTDTILSFVEGKPINVVN